MSKEAEGQAIEAFTPYQPQEGVRKFAEVLRARVERHRDFLEREDSPEVRGRIREIRDLLKILVE